MAETLMEKDIQVVSSPTWRSGGLHSKLEFVEESNLSGTKKQNREKRSWAFYQLEQFLTYKAEAVGSKVLKVSPKYTSQRCPKCGRIHKANRHHDTHEYICDKCGYRSNDDRIGAMNIQFLGTLWVSGDEHPRFGIRKEITSAE